MSQEQVERVYTINLGKVVLSPNNRRAKRAINMIREFAARHMKSENIKIEEDVSHLVWSRGIRHPPRKIRVKLTKDEDGSVLISKYQEETKAKKEEIVEEKPKAQIETTEEKPVEKKEEKVEAKPDKLAKEKSEKPKPETKPQKLKKEEKKSDEIKEKPKTKSYTKSKKK
ncbi:MAG: 50S ribosomal protein L31e [Nitrosopumilaceae archaeon]